MGATGMNEFSAFGRILGGGFPLLFPYGVGMPKEYGDVKKHAKHLMALSDRRFAQRRVFPCYIVILFKGTRVSGMLTLL